MTAPTVVGTRLQDSALPRKVPIRVSSSPFLGHRGGENDEPATVGQGLMHVRVDGCPWCDGPPQNVSVTGERRVSKGLIKEQLAMLKDQKKLAKLAFEEGSDLSRLREWVTRHSRR
jgi:hypothetical protein